jgi:PBSX family phage portal protein
MSGPRILRQAFIFDDGRITKAERPSQQIPDDPFNYGEGESGLKSPPYSMEQLAAMLETNSLHYRCVKQKATDVAGRGFVLRGKDEITPSDEEDERFAAFVEAVEDDDRGQESFKERIVAAHEDYESIGWGILEVSRRADGLLDGVWHLPAHTVRAHKDGRRFAQQRGGKTVWFKRFGLDGTVDRRDGGWAPRTVHGADYVANEVIVVRNYTPRSSFYGLPDHIPALAALAGWRAQAEFNVRFFDNHAVPAYAIVVEGAEFSPEVEDKIREHFRALKGEPSSTLIIPVPGGGEGEEIHVRFERLSVEIKDASFRLYKQDNALEICIAHGTPPYRVGWPILGSLGGATAEEMTQIYNDSIVQPRQETWEKRLTRAFLGPKGLDLRTFELKANELDTRNEERDLTRSEGLWNLNAITVRQIQRFHGIEEREDDVGEMYRDQLEMRQGELGGFLPVKADLVAKRWGEEVRALADLRARVQRALEPTEA